MKKYEKKGKAWEMQKLENNKKNTGMHAHTYKQLAGTEILYFSRFLAEIHDFPVKIRQKSLRFCKNSAQNCYAPAKIWKTTITRKSACAWKLATSS